METTSNIAQAARWLGISRQAVFKLVKNRERTGIPQAPWDEASLKEWYLNFDPRRGPKSGIRKES